MVRLVIIHAVKMAPGVKVTDLVDCRRVTATGNLSESDVFGFLDNFWPANILIFVR